MIRRVAVLAVALGVSLAARPVAAESPAGTASPDATASADAASADVASSPVASSPVAATVGEHRLEDADGNTVARFVERRAGVEISVPPGRYVHVTPDGRRREVAVTEGERFVYGSPTTAAPIDPRRSPSVTTPSTRAPADDEVPGVVALRPARTLHRPWTAPLLAAFIPGTGHALVRENGAAVAIFAGAVGLTFGTVALALAGDRREGATPGAAGRSPAAEAVAHGSFVAVTDALALLWIGQAADAWRRAKGRLLRPSTGHVVAIAVSRASTVGLRPGEPAIARYEDISVSLLGQVRPRLWFGVSDLSVFGRTARRLTVQAGLRIAGRVVERDRMWLVVGGGVLFQGTGGGSTLDRTGDGDIPPRESGRFGAVVLAQLEARFFALDRLSLDVGPRLSVPLTNRFYGGGKSLPRWAPTIELVAGPQVYF